MANFDFGNTRLRAMRARLLSTPQLLELTAVGSVERLLNALTKTPYRQAVEAALLRYSGLNCLHQALQRDLVAAAVKVRGFFRGAAAAQVELIMRRYDVENVKAILRGLARRESSEMIISATLPLGELQPADLRALTRMEELRAAIDLLASWGSPLAAPLLAAGRRRARDLFILDLELTRWYFSVVMEAAASRGTVLKKVVALEIDIANLLTVFRLCGQRTLKSQFDQQPGINKVTDLFVGVGHIAHDKLEEAARAATIEKAVAILADTPYGDHLAEAVLRTKKESRLSILEEALNLYRERTAQHMIIKDPLGIGVLWGYLVLKSAEQAALRKIGNGLQQGDSAEEVRASLGLAAGTI